MRDIEIMLWHPTFQNVAAPACTNYSHSVDFKAKAKHSKAKAKVLSGKAKAKAEAYNVTDWSGSLN